MALADQLRMLSLPSFIDDGESGNKHAAVALILGPHDQLLMIRRAPREGDPWSGDMAFPGGRRQPEDVSPIATAQRETMEEVGLPLVQAAFVGALPLQRSPVRRPELALTVFPYVFRAPSFDPVGISDEVASVHRFDIEALFDPAYRGTFRYQGWGVDRELPCIRLDGSFIWGLSLRMLDSLGEACGIPSRSAW